MVIKSQLAVLMIMPQFTVISALQIINNARLYYYHQRLDALPRRTSPRTPNAHTCRGHSLHLSDWKRPAGWQDGEASKSCRLDTYPTHINAPHTGIIAAPWWKWYICIGLDFVSIERASSYYWELLLGLRSYWVSCCKEEWWKPLDQRTLSFYSQVVF